MYHHFILIYIKLVLNFAILGFIQSRRFETREVRRDQRSVLNTNSSDSNEVYAVFSKENQINWMRLKKVKSMPK